MKTTLILALVFTNMTFSLSSFAEEKTSKISTSEGASKQSSERKSRRKKVEMCIDCGKPETECDCPGYVHESSQDEDKDEVSN